jgi:Xaa-Pro aminopeptidase
MLRLAPETFAARRARILDLIPEGGALLLPTSPERTRSNDTEFPFRPHSDFYYATGFAEPGAWALLKKGAEKPYTLFVLPKDPKKEVWTGIRAGTEGAKERFGADEAFTTEEWKDNMGKALEGVDQLWFGFGRHPEVEPQLTELLNGLRVGRKGALGPATMHDAGAFLAELRIRKTEQEMTLLREAARLSAEGHRLAMEQVRPGMHEYEIQALLEYTFRRQGAWSWAYATIVGGGANACILHYISNNDVLKDGDLMLIDAGAEVDGYAGDITRTSPVGGKFTGAQRDLYQLVLDTQVACLEAVKPGATLEGLHDDVVRQLTEGMVHLGLLEGSVDEAIEKETYKRFYMHRTSHWLGLDVHDVGRYKLASGDERPLEPGMVFTIEPGLYVAPDDDEAPERFRGIGIRIEDDVLVTQDGYENLTSDVPKTIDGIEALQA